MNEQNTEAGGNGSTNELPQFAVQRIYIKDLSFEIPGAPGIFSEQIGEQDIQLNLNNSHTAIGNNVYEVILKISVHAKMGDRSIFLIEMEQAGTFMIQGYADEDLRKILGTYCPSTLFPYARESISSTVGKGSFPALMLQPINFDALYAQAQAEQQQRADNSAA